MKLKLLLIFLILGNTVFASNVQITDFNYCDYKDKIRLVFKSNDKILYNINYLNDILKINFNKTIIKTDLKNQISSKIINCVNVLQAEENIHLEIQFKTQFKNMIHFSMNSPERLVIDLFKDNEVREKKEISDNNENTLINIYNKVHQYYAHPIIIIDPGHGGHDSGAIGYSGTQEKDITLSISKKLKNILNKSKKFNAILTRDSDIFIPLRNRLEIAHKHKANMFISIHADAYKNRDAHGASIFALSPQGATSESARWLAEKENESELGKAIFDKNYILKSVLIDLTQTATINSSLIIGGYILNTLSNIINLHSKIVEQAKFVVLKSPDIPSILIEVGFISHDIEELLLCNDRYQDAIASKLAKGVELYFSNHNYNK